MRRISLVLFLFSSLNAEFEVSGHFDLEMQQFLDRPDDKNKNAFTAKQILELEYRKDDWTLFSRGYAQEAYYDLTDDQKTERTFARLDEFYAKYDFDEDSIKIGKSIEFWGALELRNIVDGFNPVDFRDDLFANNKLGVWNVNFSHYTESGEISLILKCAEQDQKMAEYPYVYYFFPKETTYYSSLETEESPYRPSVYLKYSGSTDTEYALDYAFIYENGYDSQRYYELNQLTGAFRQHAYIVNKLMSYNTLVVGSALIKLEALYAKVDKNPYVGDYSHIAAGIEYTLENVYESASLGLIAEYYRYDTFEDDKYNDLQLFESMQNDLFIGARYSFNNTNDASLIGGGIFDAEYNEEVYYIKFESRFMEEYKVAFDYYYIDPSKTDKTAYAYLGKHQRVGLNIAYHF